MQLFNIIYETSKKILITIYPAISILSYIMIIIIILLLSVAYLIFWERKLIGWMHLRIGPNRVGPYGLLQPIADVLKLLLKEIILPSKANKWMYMFAPIITLTPAIAIWAVIPFKDGLVLSNINAGLLYIISISSVSIYGVILAGWASNSKYAFLGSMRAAAQMISYEITIGLAILAVLITSGSLNISEIVNSQKYGLFAKYGLNFLSWNWLPLFPIFIIYFISGIAETHRHPFDVIEGESEIVAGHMIEYSGIAFAIFFLSEYINMIIISTLTTILFLGGWIPPLSILSFIPKIIWLFIKVFILLSIFIWIRGTLPRYRYDQIMNLGWKVFIPICFICILIVSIWVISPLNIWK